MRKLLFGIAALPFLATAAMADPVQLSSNQMDKVTAGWRLVEVDVFNSGSAAIGVYTALPACGPQDCYLDIRTPTIHLVSFKPSDPNLPPQIFPPWP